VISIYNTTPLFDAKSFKLCFSTSQYSLKLSSVAARYVDFSQLTTRLASSSVNPCRHARSSLFPYDASVKGCASTARSFDTAGPFPLIEIRFRAWHVFWIISICLSVTGWSAIFKYSRVFALLVQTAISIGGRTSKGARRRVSARRRVQCSAMEGFSCFLCNSTSNTSTCAPNLSIHIFPWSQYNYKEVTLGKYIRIDSIVSFKDVDPYANSLTGSFTKSVFTAWPPAVCKDSRASRILQALIVSSGRRFHPSRSTDGEIQSVLHTVFTAVLFSLPARMRDWAE